MLECKGTCVRHKASLVVGTGVYHDKVRCTRCDIVLKASGTVIDKNGSKVCRCCRGQVRKKRRQ